MTIEQAIEYVEKVAAEQEYFMGQFDAAIGYARSGNEAIRTESAKECEKCAAEHRQIAEWLRELQERRKAPDIVRCGECKHYMIVQCKDCDWNDGTCYCNFHYRNVKANDHCSWAERRTDG